MFILKNRILLFLLLAGSIHTSLLGQLPEAVTVQIGKSMPNPIPGSPNAAALGKFGSYNVSHYTGLPSISIPIFEITSGSITLPITLQYHASGIRILENASWVGLGWSLSAGGQITREVRGHPDEQSYWRDPLIEYPSVCGPTGNWGYINQAETGAYDTQPDLFAYSMPAKSGSFLLGHKGESPFLFPYEPYKVTHNGINATGSFDLNSFQITDSDGMIYKFGESVPGQLAKETTTVDRNPYLPLVSTTSWLLTGINTPNSDDAVHFNYQHLGYATILEPRNSVTVLDNCIGADCPPHGPDQVLFGTNASFISQLGLHEIVFSGGKVKFIAGPKRLDQVNLNYLDRIEIYTETAGEYSLVKTVKFVYSYFNYLNSPAATVKLKLEKVQFLGSDGIIDNTYSFEYHTDGFSWNEGTPYSKDFWGYYNGKPNADLIPAQSVQYTENNSIIQRTVTIGSADRNSVGTFMKEGVLKRINFPTGGYTEFDYEPHRYLEDNVSKIAGGLRIKSVKSYDGVNDSPIVKTYAYGPNESGNGVKNFYQDLLNFQSESYIQHICCLVTSCSRVTYRQRTFFGNSMIETGASEGSAVVYPFVTEYHGDVNSNIGKIIYEYDNGAYQADSLQVILGPRSSKNFKSSYSWKRGHLTKKTIRNKNGHLISESIHSFSLYQKARKHIGTAVERLRTYTLQNPCIGTCENEFGEPILLDDFRWTGYYQMSGAMRESSSIERLYENGNTGASVTTTTNRSYDPTFLTPMIEASSGNTDSDVLVKYSRYPFSYTFTGTQTGPARAIQMLLEKNAVNTVVEQYSTRRNSDGTNERVLGGKLTIFRANANNLSQVVPDSILFVETANPIPISDFSPSTIKNANQLLHSPRYQNSIRFLSFDGQGNVNEVVRENDNITTYLWSYRQELPTAEVINSDLDVLPGTFTDLLYQGTSSFSTSVTSATALPTTFTIGHQQLVQCSINFYYSGSPTAPPFVDFVLKKSDGTVVFDPGVYRYGIYQSSFVLNPGTYRFYYTGNAYTNAQVGTVTARFTIDLAYQSKTSRNPKIYHSSFEETGIAISDAKSGAKVNVGSVVIPLPTAAGKYWITWWQKAAGQNWIEQKVLLQIPYVLGGITQTSYTVGAGATYVDEVRMYPENALMTTYTYDPILGITSTTDRNNKTTFYTYDTMGRLRNTKDADGKIVSQKIYHYKK